MEDTSYAESGWLGAGHAAASWSDCSAAGAKSGSGCLRGRPRGRLRYDDALGKQFAAPNSPWLSPLHSTS